MEPEHFQYAHAEGGITAPKGFLTAGVSAGIKKSGKRDVCLIVADGPCPAAGVFTTSATAAPPVLVSRSHLGGGALRAIAVNAGNANACTGAAGMRDALAMAEAAAAALGCSAGEVAVCSTGVIGVPLPLELVTAGIAEAATVLDSRSAEDAAEAIMTTDTFAKQLAISVEVDDRTFTVGGMAKGSGMIQPNMATMLAFITTDAPLTSESCEEILRGAVRRSFNRITVDSDTSTNDACILMASGAEGGDVLAKHTPGHDAVAAAVCEVATALAQMVVRDGEGATKFVTVTVEGALDEDEAEKVAFAIANSPLMKTALFGEDANWGRVAMAVGKSGATVDPDRLEIIFAGIPTCRDGMAVPFDEAEAAVMLAKPEIDLLVDLHLGEGKATVWTCDFSYEYVRINGEYRS